MEFKMQDKKVNDTEIKVSNKKPSVLVNKIERKDKRVNPSATGNARCN